jgi:two-component system, sensor histidine kinase and response regulator
MPARVLLIDDDRAGLDALSEALRSRLDDATVDTACDSHAALDLLREWEYNVVISDIRMPGMDGLALLNQVRERWPDVPVIVMTAMGWSPEAQALYDGAFAFLEKPIDVERLISLIQAARAKAELRKRVNVANRASLAQLYGEDSPSQKRPPKP